jgi:hydroxyacylglutathione hydrolase
MARMMFASLQRFKQLPDHLLIMPGHGAGSACGKALGAVPSSTVGFEKLANPMFQIDDEDEFVRALLDGQTTPPRYFGVMKRVNKEGPKLLTEQDRPDKLPPIVLRNALEKGTTVVDTRDPDAYAERHLPGTINIPMGDSFPNWAGSLLDYDTPFYAITDQRYDVIRDLASVGLDNLAGTFPTSTFNTMQRTTDILFHSHESRTPAQLASPIERDQVTVVDVRRVDEFAEGHIAGAINVPLGELPGRLDDLPSDKRVVVYCQGGFRSAIATSLLNQNDIDAINMDGGYDAWQAQVVNAATK